MTKRFELWGYRLEILGLVLALLGFLWQACFSGWWDTQKIEWQSHIQEDVNLAVLSTLKDIALLQTIDDPIKLKEAAYDTSQKANKALFNEIEMRDEREKGIKGQATLFSNIGFFLMSISAIFIVIGKVLVYKSAKFKYES
jgi:hypothetical protein